MTEEQLLLRFRAAYPGVHLCITHQCRLYTDKLVHEWTFWHADAGEHVGPYPTATELVEAVGVWERTGERAAACNVVAMEAIAKLRRERLTQERLNMARKADQPYTPPLIEAQRVADPTYTPTVEEAARNPEAFVEGFGEFEIDLYDPRD
jgi:hypothetical protein